MDGAAVTFILGSASPRRQELLSRLVPVERIQICPVDLDEAAMVTQWLAQHPGSRLSLNSIWASQLAREMAEAKMAALVESRAALPLASDDDKQVTEVLITADTIVVQGDQILGKPSDERSARQMLENLSGRDHLVLTGLCVRIDIGQETRQFAATEQTQVVFSELTNSQIDWYLATGEPFDKAGAYGIQGYGSVLVKSIQGCYYNVVGLPIHRLLVLLEQARLAFPSFSDSLHLLPW